MSWHPFVCGCVPVYMCKNAWSIRRTETNVSFLNVIQKKAFYTLCKRRRRKFPKFLARPAQNVSCQGWVRNRNCAASLQTFVSNRKGKVSKQILMFSDPPVPRNFALLSNMCYPIFVIRSAFVYLNSHVITRRLHPVGVQALWLKTDRRNGKRVGEVWVRKIAAVGYCIINIFIFVVSLAVVIWLKLFCFHDRNIIECESAKLLVSSHNGNKEMTLS